MQMGKIIQRVIILLSGYLTLAQGPLTMADAIEMLKENNPHIRISHEKALLAQSESSQHQARYLPKINPINIHYDALTMKTDVNASSRWKMPLGGTVDLQYQQTYTQDPNFSISYEQPITQNIGYTQDKIKSADIQIKQIQAQKQYEALVLKMRKAYYQCVMDKLVLDHQKHKLDDIRQEMNRYQILYQGGEVSKLEFEKVLHQHERTSIEFLKKEQAAEFNLITLKRLLGIPLYQVIELDTNIAYKMSIPSPMTAIAKALEHNADYQIAKFQFEKARLYHQIEKHRRLPKLSVYAQANHKKEYKAGVQLQIKMPDSEETYERTSKDLDFHHAQQSYLDEDQALRTKIHQLLLALHNQTKLIDLSAKNLQLQQSIYHAESIKFKHMEISLEDFQKASDQLQSAYQSSLQTQIEYTHLRDELLQAIGDFSLIVQPEKHHV